MKQANVRLKTLAYRYLGNKTKLATWIVDVISEIVPSGATVADPMCGTASVSECLALKGYSVVAADSLRFPVIHAASRLLVKAEPTFSQFGGYSSVLKAMNNLEPEKGFFYREYSPAGKPLNGSAPRMYFTPENAAKIDSMRSFISKSFQEGLIDEVEHVVLLQSLILAVNSVANISGTYGYYLSKFSKSSTKPIHVDPLSFKKTSGAHRVLYGSIENTATNLCSEAVYLDPPYTKRQYAGNYHILETLAREDEPFVNGKGGLRPWKEDASAFCYRRKAGKALNDVLEKLSTRDVFLSYTEDGQIAQDDMLGILASFGKVEVFEHEHPRYRSNSGARAGMISEKLYHLKME